MVFHETQRGKEAVVRDGAAEAGRGWIGEVGREGRRGTWREEEIGRVGGLAGMGGGRWDSPGDCPLQGNRNHSPL